MKRSIVQPALLFAILPMLALTLAAAATRPGSPTPSAPIDRDPPLVALRILGSPTAPIFEALVRAEDRSGIASVSFAVDGLIVATRLREPWRLDLSTYLPPFEVCAQAEDVFGNTGTACLQYGGDCQRNLDCGRLEYCRKPLGECHGQGVCAVRPDVACQEPEAVPVCGCDGRTYACEALAAIASVNVASLGPCE